MDQPRTERSADPDFTHRMQAAAFLRRWFRPGRTARASSSPLSIPERVEIPPRVLRHYRHYSWVAQEQRLMTLAVAALGVACAMVGTAALQLERKPAVVVRAPPSLKEEAAAFFRVPEISYDQLAFFLTGCLPLLYASGADGHPLLPLAQGLVAPEVYDEAERRLNRTDGEVREGGVTQSLTLTEVSGVIADAQSGRAAAEVAGFLTVTLRGRASRFIPWRARALLEATPPSRLNPYPFCLLRLEQGPQAAEPGLSQP